MRPMTRDEDKADAPQALPEILGKKEKDPKQWKVVQSMSRPTR